MPYYTSGFRRLCFTSGASAERLHPPSHKATADKQATGATSSTFAQGYGGQASKAFRFFVKMSRLHCITPRQGRKGSRLLSEERLSPRSTFA